MKNKFFLSSEEKKSTTYANAMVSNVCTHFTLGCCSCTPTATIINDTHETFDSYNGATKRKYFEEKETNVQRKKKAKGNEVVEIMSWGNNSTNLRNMKIEFFPSSEEKKLTYVDVMVSNNNTNICTHFTMCCSCTSTIFNETQEAIDSFDGTRKRKFEDDERKKNAKDNEGVETMSWGYSTELMLYDNPWKIKKVLQKSDLGNLSIDSCWVQIR